MDVLRDTMAVTGALFALLIGATVFTLVLRAFGTDRWVSSLLAPTAASSMYGPLLVVMLMLALCAFVLDAFEMTFVLRHSCGYYLADKGTDLRTVQDYLGHRDPRHTVHYTRVAGRRFEGLWK